jgi:hypothetical protein
MNRLREYTKVSIDFQQGIRNRFSCVCVGPWNTEPSGGFYRNGHSSESL